MYVCLKQLTKQFCKVAATQADQDALRRGATIAVLLAQTAACKQQPFIVKAEFLDSQGAVKIQRGCFRQVRLAFLADRLKPIWGCFSPAMLHQKVWTNFIDRA